MRVQAVGEEAEEAFGMYQAKFYVIFLLLPYKQNHTAPLLNWHNYLVSSRDGPFYTRPE